MDLKNMAITRSMMPPMEGDEVVSNVGYSNKGLSHEEKEKQYPYCLKLHLSDEELKKLGVDSLPELESSLDMIAKVKVVGARKENGQSNLELQITDMLLGKPKKEMNHQEALYGEQSKES